MLVGDVGEDRDVVGDAATRSSASAVGRRLDDRRLIAGIDHRPQRGLQLGRLGRRGVLGVVVGLPPIRVAIVPIIPVRTPAASSAATARYDGRGLAVGAGDADDRQLARRDRHTTRPRRLARAGRDASTTSCGAATSGSGRSTMSAAAPASIGRSAAKSWPSTRSPGIATKSEPGPRRRANRAVTPRHVDLSRARPRPTGRPSSARATQPSLGGEARDERRRAAAAPSGRSRGRVTAVTVRPADRGARATRPSA